MRVAASHRGVGLIDVIVTLFLLAVVGIIFSAMFPSSFAASRQAQEYKLATAIAQRKMEQVRAVRYESLTPTLLIAAQIIDDDDTSSPFSFTSTDSVGSQLAGGTGAVAVDNVSSDVKRVRVSVVWSGPPGRPSRTVELTTLFADRRTRKLN